MIGVFECLACALSRCRQGSMSGIPQEQYVVSMPALTDIDAGPVLNSWGGRRD